MHLVEVAFKGNRKEFFAWDGEQAPPARASVVVEADRGEDLGIVHAVGELAEKRCAGCAHGLGSAPPTRKALRLASHREVRQARETHALDDVARQKAAERVKAHGLPMKVSDAEWQWDRKKLTFYFTADKRVDFRDLVRDLAAMFRARIELKQIGVRDEAKRLDGIGRCGRQFCSASWLPELRPVNLGVAKDQRLSLNPSQISGACGRLMCCLRYEHEFYVASRKRFPKEGKTLVTAKGEEKVVSNEIFNERVTLRTAEGEMRVVPLAQLRRELLAAGQPLPGGEGAASDPVMALGTLDAGVSEELTLVETDTDSADRVDINVDFDQESETEDDSRPRQDSERARQMRPAESGVRADSDRATRTPHPRARSQRPDSGRNANPKSPGPSGPSGTSSRGTTAGGTAAGGRKGGSAGGPPPGTEPSGTRPGGPRPPATRPLGMRPSGTRPPGAQPAGGGAEATRTDAAPAPGLPERSRLDAEPSVADQSTGETTAAQPDRPDTGGGVPRRRRGRRGGRRNRGKGGPGPLGAPGGGGGGGGGGPETQGPESERAEGSAGAEPRGRGDVPPSGDGADRGGGASPSGAD